MAVHDKILHENPFEGIRIAVEDKEIVAPPRDIEVQVFTLLFEKKRSLFEQAFFLRMTGLRGKDSCDPKLLSELNFETALMRVHNNKGKRRYPYPMPRTVFELLGSTLSLDTWFDTPKGLAESVWDHTKGLSRIHVFKAGFANEVAPLCPTDTLRDYVIHHKPKGIGPRFYLEPPVEQARPIIDKAQAFWLQWYRDKTGTRPR